MSAPLFGLAQQVGKDFLELMRGIERISQTGPLHGSARTLRRQPDWLTIEQTADLAFATCEVDAIQIRTDPLDARMAREVVVRQRHFGLFAPYGPLPLYITEHAMHERRYERNAAFERFVNLVSARLAWNHYCAWSALHPVLGYERARNAFAERLGQLSNAPLGNAAETPISHAGACRAAYAGLYAARQRPLAPLCRMLARYFEVPVRVLPRVGRWMSVPNRGADARRLGQWRVGSRVLDAQLQTQIVIGPLCSQSMQQWKRRSACVSALVAVVNDYANGHIQPMVTVQVRSHESMAARLGAMHLGQDAWARPGNAIQTLVVYDSFQEPQ